jgi:hypothetical protein
MACSPSLSSITLDCSQNVGGIKNKIWIKLHTTPANFTTASGAISIDGVKNGSKVDSSFTNDLTTGAGSAVQTLTFVVSRRDASKYAALQLLAVGQPNLDVVYKDNNGLYWQIGYNRGAVLTQIQSASGQQVKDGSNYTLTITADELFLELNQSGFQE